MHRTSHTGDDDVTVGKFYATFLIQDYFRRFKKRKEIETKEGEGTVKAATMSLQVIVSRLEAFKNVTQYKTFSGRPETTPHSFQRNHHLFGTVVAHSASPKTSLVTTTTVVPPTHVPGTQTNDRLLPVPYDSKWRKV